MYNQKLNGFENNTSIVIFKGNTYQYLEWFKQSKATYSPLFGWFYKNMETVPADLPFDLQPIVLTMQELYDGDTGYFKSNSQIKQIVSNLTHDATTSKWIGQIGERLELHLKCKKVLSLNSMYGASTLHIFNDSDDNELVWITASKTLQEGEEYHLRGTIKDHKMYNNSCQTVLTRCFLLNK